MTKEKRKWLGRQGGEADEFHVRLVFPLRVVLFNT